MTKLTFQGVKEGFRKIGPKYMLAALMPLALLPLPVVTENTKPVPVVTQTAWKTELVLADKTPSLLVTQAKTANILVGQSRNDEQVAQAKIAAEAKARADALALQKKQQAALVAQQAAQATVTTTAPNVVTDVPYDQKVALVKSAAAAYGISPSVLMAVWQVETGMTWYTPRANPSGATGPFQFMPGTWRGYAVDGNGDGVKDIRDARDAAYAAAKLLAANGADHGDYTSALFGYNHAMWYVTKVMSLAKTYGF